MNGGVEIGRALVNPRDGDEEEVCDVIGFWGMRDSCCWNI